jgi:alkylation response protein AidB-like acyl-CoA dehydrogenase
MTTALRMRDDLVETARSLMPAIRAVADEVENARRLPTALVESLRREGLFRLWLPALIGGDELDPMQTLPIIELLAEADGSVAWNVMVAAQAATFLPFLDRDFVASTFSRDDIFAGTLVPLRAVSVDGGYRVSGRAPFASGCTHATWIFGLSRVSGSSQPIVEEDQPEMRWLFFPAAECRVLDTWYTTGLRGTGSFDYEVQEVFVPRVLASGPLPIDRRANWGGPLHQAPFLFTLRGALALGIARHAIDTLIELAANRTPQREKAVLRELARAQADLARSMAAVDAARLYLRESVREVWEAVTNGAELSDRQLVQMPLATAYTIRTCAEAIETMYRLGGGASIYASNALDRCFRDINTLMADQAAAPWVVEAAGKVLFGLGLAAGTF